MRNPYYALTCNTELLRPSISSDFVTILNGTVFFVVVIRRESLDGKTTTDVRDCLFL